MVPSLRLGALAITAALGVGIVVACSSAPKYPACERDEQCAVSGKHDYCIGGKCVYCRMSTDCADRERCRSGKCETDPDAPLPRALDAGDDDADTDGSADDEGGSEETTDDEAPAARTPRHILPRGVRRYLRP